LFHISVTLGLTFGQYFPIRVPQNTVRVLRKIKEQRNKNFKISQVIPNSTGIFVWQLAILEQSPYKNRYEIFFYFFLTV
jgi:hypothetical protein